ncbi:MAG: hypothetical protein WC326_01790 [Candidatus Delongbacteria bacterium]
MIVQRAFAAHVAGLSSGLAVFKDELAWTQGGEPWPCLLVTLVSLTPGSKGTGVYDQRSFDATAGAYTYEKFHVERQVLRLTVRSAALSGKSGATLVEEVATTIRTLMRAHAQGQPLDLVDVETGTSVHLERLRLITESDQGPQLSRVPFEAQKTLDVELVVVWPVVTAVALPMQDVNLTVDLE